MANQKDQKRKLLAIQKILFEKTDMSHPLTLSQITEELAALGIDAERKSIYSCIDALREAGMDIRTNNKPRTAYYLESRQMTPGEMTILVDIVRSCPSITNAMAEHLTEKILGLASKNQLSGLKGRITVPERSIKRSRYLLFNIRRIQHAMSRKKQIGFRYMTCDINGKFKYHKERRQPVTVHFYEINYDDGKEAFPPVHAEHYGIYTPVRIVFLAGYYYLICWDDNADYGNGNGDFRVFRIDRMSKVFIAEKKKAVRNKRIANYRPEEWEEPAFGMFYDQKGKQTITIHVVDADISEQGTSWVISSFYDKFGSGMTVTALNESEARIRLRTIASPQFFSWLLQFGGKVKIETPSNIALQYVEEYLKPALGQYSEKELKKKASAGKRSTKKAN